MRVTTRSLRSRVSHQIGNRRFVSSLKTLRLKTRGFRGTMTPGGLNAEEQFSEHQIIAILRAVKAGRTLRDVCSEHEISDATYYQWKSQTKTGA